MLMSQNHWPPRTDVIDVAVAIDVEQIGALGSLEDDRLAADAAEGPRGAIDAAGHELPGSLKNLVAFAAIHGCVSHYNRLRLFPFHVPEGRDFHVGSTQ